jgi:type II restriction enzyme
MYEEKKEENGEEAYKHISQILKDAKSIHKKTFKGTDHEQSWRAFKGKNLEKLIEYIIQDKVHEFGLEIVNGGKINIKSEREMPLNLGKVKRNLLIDYGEFGYHLPDIDMVIYHPKTSDIIAVISSKSTLRERIAQTGYWKIKLQSQPLTKHIKVYFVTPDEDKTLTVRTPAKKGRAIVEVDTDGCYVLSEEKVEESDKVKMFGRFIEDLKKLIDQNSLQKF